MADNTNIEWTDATWNPIVGCNVVSPGCTNCYAMKLAGTRLKHHPSRQGLTVDTKAGPVWTGQVRLMTRWLDQPLRWKRPRRIFVCAHGDLFAENVLDDWIDRIFAVMALCPQHTFQVLTKRSARMRAYLSDRASEGRILLQAVPADWKTSGKDRWGHLRYDRTADTWHLPWPLPNVWLGVSAEDQRRADERIPDLLATPAAIRFVSAEPLLGPVSIRQWQYDYGCGCGWGGDSPLDYCRNCGWRGFAPGAHVPGDCPECGGAIEDYQACPDCSGHDGDGMSFGPNSGARLDWIIVGGESGSGARPMHPDWARSIRDQCTAAGVPLFFKQWGEWASVSQMSEEQIDACYPPLNERHPDATRHSLVDTHVLHADGSQHRRVARDAFLHGTDAMTMFEVGKKRAGRLLDGVEHNAMPQVSR